MTAGHYSAMTGDGMGGMVSSGKSNDELVDNLVLADYISKREIERVFRAVDRGHFFPEDEEVSDLPYRDTAWRSSSGHIHISAPCIYSEVMENLNVEPGQSFLNIGSGTGYLSTMVGLLLGANGKNHGVELYEDVVAFADDRLRQFLGGRGQAALDQYEFCPPCYAVGNGLLLPAGTAYDRVYCGAACNDASMLEYIKGLVKMDGLLICPVNSELVLYTRTSCTEWTSKVLLPVAFAELIPAQLPFLRVPVLPPGNALALEELCRYCVRATVRRAILWSYPHLSLVGGKAEVCLNARKKRKACDSESDENTFPILPHRVKLDSGICDDIDGSDLDSLDWDDCGGGSESDSDLGATPPEPCDSLPSLSDLMQQKINELCLPKPLLQYLKMGRPMR